ncbi:MAG TPA: DUF177 domain-containing protein [Longimicrobiales bacterium]|nr:DUF177 domain-containing protein [Longimicrobiales bacterium]
MLKADLGLLQRRGRLEVEAQVEPDDPLWAGSGVAPDGPLRVRLEVQQAGPDVVVRGRLQVDVALWCRRCLGPVRYAVDDEVTWLFRAGISAAEAQAEEVFALPERSRELDLAPAVREQLLLAVPEFVLCEEACRGLCPQCGANRNEDDCGCTAPVVDERWAALRRRPD